MKLILFLVGVILSVWVSVIVYTPAQWFITNIEKVYLQSKAIQRTVVQKSGTTVSTITDTYKEIARVFGVKVAEESAKQEVSTPVASGTKDPVEQLFQHDLALWLSVWVGCMTLSLYLNLLSFIAFFLKPVTFLMK
jgi:hypothetical protein